MAYPDFETDLLLLVKDPFSQPIVEETLIKHLDEVEFSIDVKDVRKGEDQYTGGWFSDFSPINLYINNGFIEDHWLKKTAELNTFLEKFEVFLKPAVRVDQIMREEGFRENGRPSASLSAFFMSQEGLIFQFLFDFKGNEADYIHALKEVFATIHFFTSIETSDLHSSVNRVHVQSNRKVYWMFHDGEWKVQNPLKRVGRELNEQYRDGKDIRIKKPLVLIHENHFQQHYIFGDNWVLEADRLETMMIKPNDVSIYSSISDKNLQEAKRFYDDVIMSRVKHYYGKMPKPEEQKEYYDYFETIISAVIFAYTALEAFANICIPNDYKWVKARKEGEKTYYKNDIEFHFRLREKFKLCLKEILKTPDPTKEKWWNLFIGLEKVRKEIAHPKQAKSEERYSQFLTKRIFDIVEVHKTIINYYGKFISQRGGILLNEFPYKFGWDDVNLQLIQ
ncbi:MAG: hypothetical protein U5L96_11950 [Owenweeksia sp.]|nr:hypothetical protein [Owenweeksia sp.]